MDKVGVVIPAAGRGKRMRAAVNKQFLDLYGQPILARTVSVFQSSDAVLEIVIVGAREDIPYIEKLVEDYQFDKVRAVVLGGEERQESVYAGVKALGPAIKRVAVHDGARPLLTLEVFHRFLAEAEEFAAAILAVPMKDTVKRVDKSGKVVETLPRDELRAVQTPQLFDRDLLENAHVRAKEVGLVATDDAALVEALGFPVYAVDGMAENIKITTPEDLELAKIILRKRE